MWAEENGKAKTQTSDSTSELRGAGVSQAGITADMGALADQNAAPETAPVGGAPAEPGAASPMGSAAPLPA